MRSARQAKRASRAARARRHVVVINIVSLIDIFAILVFYLLVNALAVEVLPSTKALTLPQSVVQEPPRQTTVVMITPQAILVDNKTVMDLEAAKAVTGKLLNELKLELSTKTHYTAEGALGSNATIGEVNIMADKSIPYSVLKKVMATCTEARANKISLAVIEKKDAGAKGS